MRRQAGLTGARGAAHQNRRAVVVTLAVEHFIERRHAVETRSLLTAWSSCKLLSGSTEKPSADQERVLRQVPRYLTMRMRRVEVCSVTRWSSRITQSETYSSSVSGG